MRDKAREEELAAHDREAKASRAIADAQRAEADAQRAQVEAERLRREAEAHESEAQGVRSKTEEQMRKADELDPDVSIDKDGTRHERRNDLRAEGDRTAQPMGGSSDGRHRSDAGTVSGTDAVRPGSSRDDSDRHVGDAPGQETPRNR